MTVNELYYEFNLAINSNNESRNINIDKPSFVYLYNKAAEKWLLDFITRNRKSSEISRVSDLLVTNKPLVIASVDKGNVSYKLPEDYLEVVPGSLRTEIHSPCTGIIFNRIYKGEDINSVLANAYLRPNLKWERGVASIGSGIVIVYTDGYEATRTLMSYYKKPKKIEMEGYTTFNNTPSIDIHPEYSDFIAHSILDAVVTDVFRNTKDQLGFQLAQEREN